MQYDEVDYLLKIDENNRPKIVPYELTPVKQPEIIERR